MASDLQGSASEERDGSGGSSPALSDGGSLAAHTAHAAFQSGSPGSLASPPGLLAGAAELGRPAAVGADGVEGPHQLPATGAEPLLRSRPPSLSTLVPLAEVAAGSRAAAAEEDAGPACGATPAQPMVPVSDDDEHDTSSCDMESPARQDLDQLAAGYESSDDMDFLSTRHCINCTGDMWGSVCRACGYMDGHTASIFDPAVTPPPRANLLRAEGSAVISYDDRMLLHDENMLPLHPERADRIRAVMARLNAAQLTGRCRRLPSREATPQEVERCHVPELMSAINLLSERSRLQGNETLHWPTSDTYVNQHTALCARLSAGACVDVAVAVVRGEAASGVAIVRPPGHHAESNTAMGFCFFNNAGIAARAAQAAGAGRVLIVDWDVHHGNGTQHIFERDPSVMYMSLHRYDGGQFYPGTGSVTEVGGPGAEGCTVNVPWPCGGMRNGDYMAAFQHLLLPIAHEFAPDLVLVSAGFDAAEGDPIGGCLLTPEVYAHMTAMLQMVAPTVLLLEGGYNLVSVAKSTEACVRVLLGERPLPLPSHQHACEAGMGAIALAMRVQSRYWRSVRGLLARLVPLPAAQPQLPHARQLQASHGEEADEDTDTPHLPHARGAREFASGSGWESDADPLSGASLGDSGERGGRHSRGGAHGAHPNQCLALHHHDTSDTELTERSLGAAEGDAEPEEVAAGAGGGWGRAGSGSGELLPQHHPHAAAAQLQMSPPYHAAALDAASPDLLPPAQLGLQPQEPCCSGGVPTPHLGGGPVSTATTPCTHQPAAGGGEGEGEPSSAAAAHWRKLTLKVLMKRAGQKGPRLSPQLVREAMREPEEPPFEHPASG